MLQTRAAKLSGVARIKCGVDMVSEGLLAVEDALLQAEAEELTRVCIEVLQMTAPVA